MRSSLLLMLLAAPSALAQSFKFDGFISARAISVDAQRSWAAGGLGKFDVGAEGEKKRRTVNVETAQLGFDWTPIRWLSIHADGIARREPEETEGKRAGLVQAYAEFFTEQWRVRAGTFWLPTSRENVDPLWNSRYTLTYSALNSWIAQEVRPIAVDVQYSPSFYVMLGATAFRGNDTMGTVLSYRGWTFGNRLSVYNEDLPVPPPQHPPRAIGSDLDGKNGYSGRIRVQLPERALVQLTHVENRAPLLPELKGQEPWRTKFDVAALQIGQASPRIIAAEWMKGWTAIGFPGGSFKVDFATAYLLVSQKSGRDRWTTRIETFSTRDHERVEDDSSRESGRAVTIAFLRDINPKVRFGAEYARVKGHRAGAKVDGSTITIELRYAF